MGYKGLLFWIYGIGSVTSKGQTRFNYLWSRNLTYLNGGPGKGNYAKEPEMTKLRGDLPRFVMYHATPMSNMVSIQKHGLIPMPVPYKTLWSPKEHIIYLSDSIDTAKEYANQAYMMRKSDARAWAIFKIQYDEFPDSVYLDLDWGLPGTYYVKIPIPPEHIKFVERYFVSPWIRK